MKKEHKPLANLNEIGLLSINELNNHPNINTFYVGSYQRGYRWGKDEVISLLDDINGIEEDKKYCIQPLAVTPKEEGAWELIDGQQRCTTIYLILTVFKNHFSKVIDSYYRLDYNTREATRDFLNEIRENNTIKVTQEKNLWDDFTSEYPEKDNIDNYHIFNAYNYIHNWLVSQSKEALKLFFTKLLHQTYVIWHPKTITKESSQTIEDFFINMNAGKIKLTSAELIKALFIIDIEKSNEPWDIRDFKKKKLANEWDSIENELHNNTFWYFINNNEKDYPTRIGKLFDIHCNKPKNKTDLYAYYQYSKGFKQGGKALEWHTIKQIFQRLKEWYEDVETYHLIGYIINTGFLTLDKIIEETQAMKKTQIKEFFQQTIIDQFNSSRNVKDKGTIKPYAIENLDYQDCYYECKNVLLLYNIKLIEGTFPNQRFPFDLYQNPETKWSIEHIHPQNPDLKEKESALEWLNDYKLRVTDELEEADKLEILPKVVYLEKELNNLKDNSIPRDLSNQIKEFSNAMDVSLDLHKIGNQALLDRNTNSKIGNKGFLKKRSLLLQTNQGQNYIPLATINNFLKKTTETVGKEVIKVNYWSTKDAEDYTKDIEILLEDYLPKTKN
jgi:hypothetical protein